MEDHVLSRKRTRLSLLATGLDGMRGPSQQHSDVFALLAERGGRTKVLEKELHEAHASKGILERQLKQSQGEIEALKVRRHHQK